MWKERQAFRWINVHYSKITCRSCRNEKRIKTYLGTIESSNDYLILHLLFSPQPLHSTVLYIFVTRVFPLRKSEKQFLQNFFLYFPSLILYFMAKRFIFLVYFGLSLFFWEKKSSIFLCTSFFVNLFFIKINEDSIRASPLDGDYHIRRNRLNFCVRNGNRCFPITMAVFNNTQNLKYKKLSNILWKM